MAASATPSTGPPPIASPLWDERGVVTPSACRAASAAASTASALMGGGSGDPRRRAHHWSPPSLRGRAGHYALSPGTLA